MALPILLSDADDRLHGLDFARHNAEVVEVWDGFRAGQPKRPPVILGANTRYFMRHPRANAAGITFREYSEDPDRMFEAQLGFQRWSKFNLLQDAPLGLPDRWQIHLDFQNWYEAAWLGCPLAYHDGEVPDTLPIFADCPERIMENGSPDPFGGILARGLEFYGRYRERCADETYFDRPIEPFPPWFGVGTDGPFTVACNVFGAAFVCEAIAVEPERMQLLLDFITDATIHRMAAWRELAGIPVPQDGFMMADDSIALISTAMYRDHVLPLHRQMYDRFATAAGRGIHLCGNATRHFPTLRDELGITVFDTGFPVDFAALRRRLGADITIQGGPNIELMRTASPAEVNAEARRILDSGVLEGGRFVLREGNNLAPGTPLENTEALYFTGRGWQAA